MGVHWFERELCIYEAVQGEGMLRYGTGVPRYERDPGVYGSVQSEGALRCVRYWWMGRWKTG